MNHQSFCSKNVNVDVEIDLTKIVHAIVEILEILLQKVHQKRKKPRKVRHSEVYMKQKLI